MCKPNNVTEWLSGLHEVLTQLYSPSVSELQSIAVHIEKEALSSSHLLVAHLGGREHLAMLQRALIRYLFAHLPIRGWGQALTLPWVCLAPHHYALSLHWCWASLPHPPFLQNDVPAGTLRKTRLNQCETHFYKISVCGGGGNHHMFTSCL